MAKRKTTKYIQRRSILILVMAIVLVLGVFIAGVTLKPKEKPYAKPVGWATHTPDNTPLRFDLPASWNVKTDIKTVKPSDNAFERRSNYSQTTTTAYENEPTNVRMLITYQDGYDGLSDHSNECHPESMRDRDVNVTNEFTSYGKIEICGERKLWQYNYEKGRKKINVISVSGLDIETYKTVIQSLRLNK